MAKQTEVTITHQARAKGGRYIAFVAGEDVTGHLDWEPEGDHCETNVRIATHTIVPDAIGGRGVAARLVEQLMRDAREQGFKIAPQCWYVAHKFDRNPEWADLRA